MRRSPLHMIVLGVGLLSFGALVLAYKPPGPWHREPFQERREFHFTNGGHYGDNILNLKFLYNNAAILKANDIFIYYYYPVGNIGKVEELSKYVDKDVVQLETGAPPPEVIELWMKNPIDGITAFSNFTRYYSLLYESILRRFGLDNKGIDTSLFQKEDYLLSIYEKLEEPYKNIDILVLNAEPKSGQFIYNKATFDELVRGLSKHFRIVTTTPVDSIPSTMGGGLSLQDIGAVSTHAKYIFGINSGPLIPCFNAATKASVKKWILLDSFPFRFDDINYIITSRLPSLQELLSDITIE